MLITEIKKKKYLLLLMILVWLMSWQHAQAQAEFSSATLPVAITHFPPFEFEQDGKVVGFDTEIVRQVLTRLGYQLDIRVLPWKRAQKYAKEGAVAALYGLTKTREREQFYYFSDPISTVEDVFFKLRKKKILWEHLDDLKPYRVGGNSGYRYADVFMNAMAADTFASVDLLPTELTQLRRLKMGRIDLFICERKVCQYLLNIHRPEFDMIDYVDISVGKVRPYFIGFSKKWPGAEQLVGEFNSELAKFIREGKHNLIYAKYGLTISLDK